MEVINKLVRDYSIDLNKCKIMDTNKKKYITLDELAHGLDTKPGKYEIQPSATLPPSDDCYVGVKYAEVIYKTSIINISTLIRYISIFRFTEEVRAYIYDITRPVEIRFVSLQHNLHIAHKLCKDKPNVKLIITYNNSKYCFGDIYDLIRIDPDFLSHTDLTRKELDNLFVTGFKFDRHKFLARG